VNVHFTRVGVVCVTVGVVACIHSLISCKVVGNGGTWTLSLCTPRRRNQVM